MITNLKYPCTNENLEAINKGLDISRNDRVLGICGSGDQMISVLEYSPEYVKMIDNDLKQLNFAENRINQIRNGDFEGFLEIGALLDCNYNLEYVDKRKIYFSDIRRFNKIGRNLDKLELDGPIDIKRYIEKSQSEMFNKIYVSNALCYNNKDDVYGLYDTFHDLNRMLLKDGLVYISNGWEVKTKLRDTPKGFCIDANLTHKAASLEDDWDPLVIRKI